VDPLAEKYPGWTPYHYVHNNPVNMVDPTGMEADGWRKDRQTGEMNYDESYTFENTDDAKFEYGDVFYQNGTEYKSDGSTSYSGESVSCIECHHNATLPNGSKNTPYGVMLYGNESTSWKSPLGSKMMEVSDIQGWLDLSDEFSPEVSKRLENASELFKYLDFSSKPKKSTNSKVSYPLVDFELAGFWGSDYVKVMPFHRKDTVIDKKDVSKMDLFREMDSIQQVPRSNRYNDSVRLSIKNRFKK